MHVIIYWLLYFTIQYSQVVKYIFLLIIHVKYFYLISFQSFYSSKFFFIGYTFNNFYFLKHKALACV